MQGNSDKVNIMAKRKVWKKSVYRSETWKNRRVKISRSPRGRFVSWHVTRSYRRGITARRRWEGREKAKFTGRHISIWADNRRWEVYGSGKNLYDFVKNIGYWNGPRERFKRIYAEDVRPEDIGEEWHEPEIRS